MYPGIMSNKGPGSPNQAWGFRGKFMLILNLEVYLNYEKEDKEEIKMTIDEAKALIVDYGSYKKSPVTLGELKKKLHRILTGVTHL